MARRRGGLIGGQGGYQEQIKQGKFDKANPSGSLKKDVEKFDKNRKNTVTNTVRRIVNQQPSASPQMQVVASNLRNSGFDPTSIKPKYRDMISKGNTPNIFEQVRNGKNIFDPLGFKQKREERDKKVAAAAVSITSKEDWYNSIDRSFGAGRGNKLSDFLAFQEKAKYRFLDRGKKPDSIKGLVEDAVEQMTGSSLTREMDEVNTALNGYYSYGITPEEWQKWQDENTYEIEVKGHKERRLKANCELPPMRYDAEGNVVSKERQEQLRKTYEDVSLYSAGAQHFATEAEKKKKDEKKRSKYTANYNDTETQNSYADVFLDALNDDTNKYKSPWSYSTTGGEYFKSNDFGPKFFKDLWKYHKKYIFKPLQEGDFLVLGNNVLTNLGETLDIGARGAKAFQYGDRGIYGTKSGMTNLKNDQWVYGSGTNVSEKQRKKTQKELIKLGALEAINGGSGLRAGGALGASHSSKKEIEKRIKEAGLWNEYKQFRKEYLSEDFNSFKTRAESVKKAYTTKRREHYDVDTGNVFLDMGVEMLSDPTVLLSAGAALGRRASKSGAENMARRFASDMFERAGISNDAALDRVAREYGKRFSDSLLTKSRVAVARDIRDLRYNVGRMLYPNVEGVAEQFVKDTVQESKILLKEISDQLNSYSFRFVNSLNKLDDVVDQVDRFLLKSVFDLPYVSYKSIKVPFNIMRRTSREARHVNRRLVAEARRNLVNPETGQLDVFSYEKIDSDAVDESIKDVVSQEIVANTELVLRDIQKLTDECKVVEADQLYKRLDNYVKEATGGKASTYSEYLEYIDNLPFGNERLDLIRESFRLQKKNIDTQYYRAQFKNNWDYTRTLQKLVNDENNSIDDLYSIIEENFSLISDRGLRENIAAMQDSVRLFDSPVEQREFYKNSLEAMLDKYRTENVFYSKNLVNDDVGRYIDRDQLLVDNSAKLPVDDGTVLGTKSKNFFTMLLGGEFGNSSFKQLYNLVTRSGGTKGKVGVIQGDSVLDDMIQADGPGVFRRYKSSFRNEPEIVQAAKSKASVLAEDLYVTEAKVRLKSKDKIKGVDLDYDKVYADLTPEEHAVLSDLVLQDGYFIKLKNGEKYPVEKTKKFKAWVSDEGEVVPTYKKYLKDHPDYYKIIRDNTDPADYVRASAKSLLDNIDEDLWLTNWLSDQLKNISKNAGAGDNLDMFKVSVLDVDTLSKMVTFKGGRVRKLFYENKGKRYINPSYKKLFPLEKLQGQYLAPIEERLGRSLTRFEKEVLQEYYIRVNHKVYTTARKNFLDAVQAELYKGYKNYADRVSQQNFEGYQKYLQSQNVNYYNHFDSPFRKILEQHGLYYRDLSINERLARERFLHQVYVNNKIAYRRRINTETYGLFQQYVRKRKRAFETDWGSLSNITVAEIAEPLQKGILNMEEKAMLKSFSAGSNSIPEVAQVVIETFKDVIRNAETNGLSEEQVSLAVKKMKAVEKNHYLAALSDFDLTLYIRAKEFNTELLAQKEYGLKVSAEQDIVQLQEDIAHRFFRFMRSNKFSNAIMNLTTSDSLFGKYYLRLKSNDLPVVQEPSAGWWVAPSDSLAALHAAQDEVNKEIAERQLAFATRLGELFTMSEKYTAFNHFVNRVESSSLSFEKKKAVVETLFGSHKSNADDLRDALSVGVNKIVDNTNAQMTALYGKDKVSLDSFRKQITDFDGQLYQDLRSRFGDIVDASYVKDRILKLCEGGHLNPVDDVRVSILQNIVRDNTFITRMNEYAKVQAVTVLDLETTGLSLQKDNIISIATFDWDGLDKVDDLESILDYLEDSSHTKLYQTKMSEDYINTNIDPNVILKMFENDPTINSYDAALKAFKEVYGASNENEIVSEFDQLSEFIIDLDNKAVAYDGSVPKLVVHNANGFDLNMLFSRLSDPDYLEFPQHIKNLDALKSESFNMLEDLVGLQGDIRLTKQQELEVREIVSEYASSIGSGETLSVIDVDEMMSIFDEILGFMEDTQGRAIKNRASKELSELPIDGNVVEDILNDVDLYNELKVIREELSKETDEIYKSDFSYSFVKDTHKGNQFEGYRQHSLMKELNEDIDSELLQISYKKIVSRDSVFKFFNTAGREDTFAELTRMGNIMRNVLRDTERRMKRNTIVERPEVMKACADVIQFARVIAVDLPKGHECAIWKHLRTPENAYERYALAKMLYDRLNRYTSDYVELVDDTSGDKALLIDYKDMSYKQRQATTEYFYWGEAFESFISSEVNSAYFTSQNILYEIYKDKPKPIARKYSEAIKTDFQDFKMLGERVRSGLSSLKAVLEGSVTVNLTDTHNARLRAINGIATEAADLFDDIAAESETVARDTLIETIGDLYKLNKEKQNLQILSYINQSEDNLLSHLLFHGKFLVVPAKGSAEHINEFNKLRSMLKTADESKVYSEFDGKYLYIGIDKRWENKLQIDKDGRTIREDAEMFFGDEQKAYTAPQYKLLGVDRQYAYEQFDNRIEELEKQWQEPYGLSAEHYDLLQRSLDYMEHYEHHMANLTGGTSIGSLGFLHDTKTTQGAYANFSDSFRRNTLSEEYVNNERWTHTPNMQMCFLGDADNCWHVGKVDVEETDVLFGTFDTLVRTAKRASTEACYLDFMFNKDDALNINKLLEGIPEDEFIEELARNEDISVVALFNANSDTGYEIKELKIESKADLDQARKFNAIVMDYASYMDMAEVVNRTTSNSELFKWWARFATIQKQVVLFRPMTWVRNAIDAYTKGVIDTKAPAALSANIIKAGHMLHQYKRINRVVETSRGLYHNTEEDIRRNFDGIVQAAFGNKTDKIMDYDTYMQLDDWMNAGRSGGLSRQALEIDKQVKRGRAWKDKTKSSVSGRDVVSSDYAKVRGMTSEEVSRLYDDLSQAEKNIMDKDTFLSIHSESKLNVSDVQLTQYEKLLDSIVYGYRDNTLNWNSLKRVTARTYDKVSNAALFGMSYAEEHLRLAQYLTLADQGFSESAIHRHIVDSQFDTTIKSQSQKILETVVPFYSFAKSNMSFWAGLVQKDPTSLRMLEHIFSQLSWNMDEMDPNDYYSMQQIMSGNLNADLLPDNPFFDMTGWFKLNPSVMDAFNLAWGPGQKFVNLLYPPFKAGLGYAAYESGADLAAIFGRDFGTQWQDMSIYESLPIVAPLHSLAENPMSLIDTGLRFSKDQFEQNSFELYCSDLEKQGMYWNSLTGKPEPLELKSGTDLDYQGLSFAYRKWYEQTQRGRLWDSNVHAWVPVSDYTFGGLNKEWDFSKPGQFDAFCKEYEKRFDKKWDNNQGKFVDPKDYIPGMLNRKDLSWKEVLYYHKKMFPDERWDANQGKFVPKEEYIPGGLNSKGLSWNELCALKYHLRGEEWNYEEHRWEKTHEPDIEILSYEYHTTLNQDFDKTIDKSKHSESFLDRMKLVAYADSKEKGAAAALNDILSGMRMQSSLLRTMNPKALTGNPANDAAVLGAIMDKAAEYDKQRSYPYKKFDRSYNYRSGRAGDVTFRKTSFVPSKQNFVQLYGNPGLQINHKRYNDPFSFGNDNSGLRMAVSKYAAYDTYYSYEYSKLYHKTGTKDVLAHYPQTSEAIQRYGNRFNNTYKINGYYRGVYTATNFKGLSTTIRNNLREQNKLHDYQH